MQYMNTTTINANYYYETIGSDLINITIKWNVRNIAGNDSAEGFILQHMNIESNISSVPNSDYWEAWQVVDGYIDRKDYAYDDNWNPLPSYLVDCCRDEINASLDGIVRYSAEVFWIPRQSKAYNEIIQWSPASGSLAGDLPTAMILNQDVKDFLVCKRRHEWNYKQILGKITG